MYNLNSQWEFAVWQRAQPSALDNLEGWDGVEGGSEVPEAADIVPTADSCWCMAETNTIVWSNYPPIKNKVK